METSLGTERLLGNQEETVGNSKCTEEKEESWKSNCGEHMEHRRCEFASQQKRPCSSLFWGSVFSEVLPTISYEPEFRKPSHLCLFVCSSVLNIPLSDGS